MEDVNADSLSSTNPVTIDADVAHHPRRVHTMVISNSLYNPSWLAMKKEQEVSLHNIITMARDLRVRFDRFELWLEPVPHQGNIYDLCAHRS
ncbi:hypothetical protein H2248_002141 [Termitomyces sp. 'cryptogamus']|nr:hypothetical protein H2248_002141 [Termitomyces sp. 'cryptogamus']